MTSRASHLTIICGSALAILSASSFAAGSFIVDLTHPIPTFQPMEGDPMKPDMSKPWLDSTAIPSFGQQTVFSIGQFPTNQGPSTSARWCSPSTTAPISTARPSNSR